MIILWEPPVICCPNIPNDKSDNMCPICETGNLTYVRESRLVEYRGCAYEVPIHYSTCNYCGSDSCDHEQTLINKQSMINYKLWVDNMRDNI